jgi:hypothetical protein
MFKILILLSSLYMLSHLNVVNAKIIKHKKKSHSTHLQKKSKRHKRHHGNGPDLKAITKESSYTANPDNGVTPLEKTGNTN